MVALEGTRCALFRSHYGNQAASPFEYENPASRRIRLELTGWAAQYKGMPNRSRLLLRFFVWLFLGAIGGFAASKRSLMLWRLFVSLSVAAIAGFAALIGSKLVDERMQQLWVDVAAVAFFGAVIDVLGGPTSVLGQVRKTLCCSAKLSKLK